MIALSLYFPLCKAIVKGGLEQNFATWALWTLLDVIATITIIIDKGNFGLVAAYVCGGIATSVCILLSPAKVRLTWVELMTIALVLACIDIWIYFGSSMTVIASSVAVVIAGIPQGFDAWKNPDRKSAMIYAGYFIANTLSLIGGKNWSIEERYYPALTMGLCLTITLCFMRKTANKPVAFEHALASS
jgi:hypothetical protein